MIENRKRGDAAQIKIDPEFQHLIPPLSTEEYSGLEQSLLDEGCRDALVVWDGTLIDGHNRYEICKRHGIPFETVERFFANRDAAIEWIILNQFGRRNLPQHERARLALRLKPIMAKEARERQATSTGGSSPQLVPNLAQGGDKGKTREKLAQIAGVGHTTLDKVERIENEAPKPVRDASRRGEMSINAAYQVVQMEPEQQQEVASRIESGEKAAEVVKEVKNRNVTVLPKPQPVVAEPPMTRPPAPDAKYHGGGSKEYRERRDAIAKSVAELYDYTPIPPVITDLTNSIMWDSQAFVDLLRGHFEQHAGLVTAENTQVILEALDTYLINPINEIRGKVANETRKRS